MGAIFIAREHGLHLPHRYRVHAEGGTRSHYGVDDILCAASGVVALGRVHFLRAQTFDPIEPFRPIYYSPRPGEKS